MSNNFMDNANATSVVTAIGDKIKTRDKTFYGTEAQWAALSTAQKKEYDFKATPDGGSKSSMIFADVPVGTILSYGGVSISKEWMLCQGQELLKADYPELYSVIADRFGTASDSSHFKLPDLRGEFLRGSGINSHANQGNGAAVGAHQDATAFPPLLSTKSNHKVGIISNSEGDLNVYNRDSAIVKYSEGTRSWQMATASDQSTGLTYDLLTVRPTSTSVNFIIKVKNSVDVITDINNYSTDEKVIGVWTDGKPLYQRTFTGTSSTYSDSGSRRIFNMELDSTINLKGAQGYVKITDATTSNFIGVENIIGSTAFGTDNNIQFAVQVGKFAIGPGGTFTNVLVYACTTSIGVTELEYYVTGQYTKTTD